MFIMLRCNYISGFIDEKTRFLWVIKAENR